nr:hypothetical protein [Tanacetum cinerariifolium]
VFFLIAEMDLFSLIRAPNPTKVKTGSHSRAPHELSLLTLTASRVIEMDEPAVATDSSGVPSAIEKSPLDFANEAEASGQETAATEVPPPEEVPVTTVLGRDQAAPVAVEPPVQESRKRGREGIGANAPPKSLQRDHADLQPSGVPADVSDPDPLAFADAPSPRPADVVRSSQGVAAAGDPGSENVSSPTVVGSPGSVYRPVWGVTNGILLDTPEACQDLVDHAAPSGYFSELRHMHNEDFLGQYNINLARGSSRTKNPSSGVRNKEPGSVVDTLQQQVSGEETLKAAFEDYKRQQDQMVEQRCAEMDARLDAMSIDFDEELYPHMLTSIAGRMWVIGHGLRLATMKCAESLEMRQAFTDVVSAGIAKGMREGLKHRVEHGHAQRTIESLEAYDPEADAKFAAALQSLKDLKLSLLDQLEGLKDAPVKTLWIMLLLRATFLMSNERLSQQVDTLQQQVSGEETLKAAFKDYKRQQDQMVEQRCAEMDARLDAMSIDFDEELYPHMLTAIAGRSPSVAKRLEVTFAGPAEGLKGCSYDVIMASLYLKDDTGDDAPQFIRDLRPNSSQLAILVYPEVREPRNPWACIEEIKLADAIAANISRAKQKKRSRIVCRTHGVGSTHHARSDRVPVSAPIVVPQGLALILVDAATQTDPDA